MRNWDPRTYAEVFCRLLNFSQPVSHVAHAVGLSKMQVAHFKDQLDVDITALPPNFRPAPQELIDTVQAELELSIPNEAPPRGPGRPRKPEVTIDNAALDAEIGGCADLAKQVAAAYPGLSARAFLHKVITDARSAG